MTLTGISVSAGQTLELQFLMTETGGAHASSITFDTLDVSATGIVPVPEPVHYALAVFGLVFVSTGVGRWYHGRAKRV